MTIRLDDPTPGQPACVSENRTVSAQDVEEIAIEAYLYAYPLVLMDVTRRVLTNIDKPATDGSRPQAPINQFAHLSNFPDAAFTEVVRPNADTFYSSLWFDVAKEPLVISVPDSQGRYYLLPTLDLWSDVFASPGARTTGTAPQVFAIVGPEWQGSLPPGIEALRSPTSLGWVIGRTYTHGKADYAAARKFQAGITVTPLSAWGKPYQAPAGAVDSTISQTAPVEQVERLEIADFLGRFAKLLSHNPPHATDYPILARLARVGIIPGRPIDLAALEPAMRAAFGRAAVTAHERMNHALLHGGKHVRGWKMGMNPIGSYGTNYLNRALVALIGLGANVVEDAVYPTAFVDGDGRALDSAAKYLLRFPKDALPPVRAFWSLTMYNAAQLFAANPIDKYTIGDRDMLERNADGSLDIYIQRKSPGAGRERNWLPAPDSGPFSVTLRLYWPKFAALDGTWNPPAIKRLE
jgi:hypothetical protein